MDKKYQTGAAVLALFAVGAFVVSKQAGGNSDTTCGLTTAAASTIVLGLTHGKDAEEIFAPAATAVIVPLGCKPVVNTLINDPSTKVSLNTPDGTTVLTGNQLTTGAAVSCDNWLAPTFHELCREGRLRPVAPYGRSG
jgi:hypothetical protein